MSEELNLSATQKEYHGTTRAYITGFLASIFFTVISFGLVITKALTGTDLVITLTCLALVQAIFQLRFFLHLGSEAKPRWESITFLFMVMVLLIIAFGSLWIMRDLNDRVMVDMNNMEMKHD